MGLSDSFVTLRLFKSSVRWTWTACPFLLNNRVNVQWDHVPQIRVGLMRRFIDQLLKRSGRAECRYLLPAAFFRRALDQERMRTDRMGGVFSLIELQFDPTDHFEVDLRRFERVLEGRLRCTDTAGLMGSRAVGVLLPDTSSRGARQVVRDLTELWGPLGTTLVAKVSVYSSSRDEDLWRPKDDGPTSRRDRSDRRRQTPQPESMPSGAEVLLFVRPLPLWKRTLDLIGAGVGILLLGPLLAFVAAVILLTSGRPVLFKQQRAGLGGHPFWIYKFRTMCRDAESRKAELRSLSEQDGPAFKLKADPRITRLGRFLRKSSIDEFPQLWNVLRGEMTLVGPRPLPCDESNECLGWQRRRLEVTPGLTCIWQVEGKSQVPFVEWMRMDLRYIQTRTLWQDLKLIARTALAVVFHQASH